MIIELNFFTQNTGFGLRIQTARMNNFYCSVYASRGFVPIIDISFLAPKTIGCMVVYHSDSLHERVANRGTDESKTTFF